jgi:hypothetical protein
LGRQPPALGPERLEESLMSLAVVSNQGFLVRVIAVYVPYAANHAEDCIGAVLIVDLPGSLEDET